MERVGLIFAEAPSSAWFCERASRLGGYLDRERLVSAGSEALPNSFPTPFLAARAVPPPGIFSRCLVVFLVRSAWVSASVLALRFPSPRSLSDPRSGM